VLIPFCLMLFGILLTHDTECQALAPSHSSHQEVHDPISRHMAHFMQPIKFTNHGLRCYIKHAYNIPEYGTDFLPNNLFHMVQFLERKTDQICHYYQSVLRMFGNKLKQSMYVNPYALSEMLDEILPLMKDACNKQTIPTFAHLQKDISQLMYDNMLNRFDYLKVDPDAYFSDLTTDILSLVHSSHELSADSSVQELRKSIQVFFEVAFNKLVWDPHAPKDAWHNVKLLADQLTRFHQQNVVSDEDDLNDLFVTLLERFCLYLDLSAPDLPLAFYHELRSDIAQKNLLFLELEEDQYFASKATRLERVITMTEAKTRAYQQGILVS